MRILSTVLVPVFLSASLVSAHFRYQEEIPNGKSVMRNGALWSGVGHAGKGGGGALNAFGEAFAAAGHTWTKELCNADTDGDGFSNGAELGDLVSVLLDLTFYDRRDAEDAELLHDVALADEDGGEHHETLEERGELGDRHV